MKTYHGSCACGKVKFEADIDLSVGTFKCNCTVCWKYRFWGVRVPHGTIRVTQGQENVVHWGQTRKHHICSSCGVKLFGVGVEKSAVNLAALDDLDKAELSKVTVKYANGLEDKFTEEPAFKELL